MILAVLRTNVRAWEEESPSHPREVAAGSGITRSPPAD
jgi:hypothetical protein